MHSHFLATTLNFVTFHPVHFKQGNTFFYAVFARKKSFKYQNFFPCGIYAAIDLNHQHMCSLQHPHTYVGSKINNYATTIGT